MIFSENVKIGLKDIDSNKNLKLKSILEYFENIAGHHADSLNYGLNNEEVKNNWILLDWKVQILQNIKYGQNLKVTTWSKSIDKCYGIRNFQIFDENNNLCVIASSKWLLINMSNGTIARADSKLIETFESEPNNSVFEDETFTKIPIPETFINSTPYEVKITDLDIFKHMHNLNYLDLAILALPSNLQEDNNFSNLRISYKKELKKDDKVFCKYVYENNKHIIVIENQETNVIHSIIELN